MVQAKGEITCANIVELLQVTPPQAYRILQKLKDAGQLSLEGKGADFKYHTAKKGKHTRVLKRMRAFRLLSFRALKNIQDMIWRKKGSGLIFATRSKSDGAIRGE